MKIIFLTRDCHFKFPAREVLRSKFRILDQIEIRLSFIYIKSEVKLAIRKMYSYMQSYIDYNLFSSSYILLIYSFST